MDVELHVTLKSDYLFLKKKASNLQDNNNIDFIFQELKDMCRPSLVLNLPECHGRLQILSDPLTPKKRKVEAACPDKADQPAILAQPPSPHTLPTTITFIQIL